MAAARSATSLLFPLAMLAITACGDDQGPENIDNPVAGFAITLRAQAGQPVIGADDQLEQTISCSVTLRATASGVGIATWQDATVYWYAGLDRSVPIDSATLAASDVRKSWGDDAIASGETREARWDIGGYSPFAFRFAYRYRAGAGGAVGTVTAMFTCGPDIPSDAALPEVTDLAVEAPPGALEPGDTLTVRYTATSAIGLWETRLVMSGPCDTKQVFGEGLTPTATREVRLPIPSACTLGVPLSVGIGATDAALQERTRLSTMAPVLSDVTPPWVDIRSVPPGGWGSIMPGVGGTYFGGDTITVIFGASDNHALRTLVWEVQPWGFRDSLAVTGNDAGPWIPIVVQNAWAGPIQLRFYARDAVGLVSDTATSDPGLRALPTVERSAVSRTISGEVRDLVIDQRRGVLYLLRPSAQQITILETATLNTSGVVATPAAADDIDLTPGGDSLLLTFSGLRALGVIDLQPASRQTTLLPLTSLDTTLDQRPVLVRTLTNGKVFVRLGGSNPAGWTLLELDLTTGVATTRTDAGIDGNVGAAQMERSHDHTALVLNGPFQKYEVATNSFGPLGTAIPGDVRPSIDEHGDFVSVGLDLYDGSLQFLGEAESMVPANSSSYVPTALSPSGQYVYQSMPGWGILRARVADGVLIDRTRSPLSASFLRVSDDGMLLVEVYDDYGAAAVIRVVDLR